MTVLISFVTFFWLWKYLWFYQFFNIYSKNASNNVTYRLQFVNKLSSFLESRDLKFGKTFTVEDFLIFFYNNFDSVANVQRKIFRQTTNKWENRVELTVFSIFQVHRILQIFLWILSPYLQAFRTIQPKCRISLWSVQVHPEMNEKYYIIVSMKLFEN